MKNGGGEANEANGANFSPLGANMGANFHHWGQIWGQIWGQKGQMELRQPLGELGSSQNMPGIRGKKSGANLGKLGAIHLNCLGNSELAVIYNIECK